MWGDRSWFHPGCQVEDSVMFIKELLEEIGDGSIRKPFAGSENLSDDGGCLSMGIGVHQFGLGLYFLTVVVGLPCLGPLYCSFYVPLVGVFVPRVGDWCISGHVACC